MNKTIALGLLFVVITACNAWGEEIVTYEKYSYEFRNGKYTQKGINQNFVYLLDAERNILVDKNNSSYEYQVVSYSPQIVCVRTRPQGIEVLTLRKDTGDYYFFSTTYILLDFGKELRQGDNFTVLSYGTYQIKE
jgi:hypothetical protein